MNAITTPRAGTTADGASNGAAPASSLLLSSMGKPASR
jgi:hypothetical protein